MQKVGLGKISADDRMYLMNHWMDLNGYIGKYYIFHEGFLLVLFDLGDTKCMQSYKSNTTKQLTNVVLLIAWSILMEFYYDPRKKNVQFFNANLLQYWRLVVFDVYLVITDNILQMV